MVLQGLDMLATAVPTGGYVSGLKAIPVVVVVLVWARLLTWVDKDVLAANMPRDKINSGLMGGFIAGLVLFLLIPNFLLAFPALLAVVGTEAFVYLQMRKAKIGLGDIRTDFNAWLRNLGGGPKEVEEISGAVQLVGANGALLPAPKRDTPEAAAYEGIQKMLTDPLTNNAELVEVAPTAEGSAVKYAVDGVTYDGATLTKSVAADAMVYLKAAAGLDVGEVRKPQKGSLKVNIFGKKREMRFDTKGSSAGESARFTANAKGRHDFNPQTLGLTEEQRATIKKVNDAGGGITVLSAPRGQGLTSLSYAMLRGHDAFLHYLQSVERDPEQDLEGITQNKLDRGATAAEEAKMVRWILSQKPDVLLISKPESPETAAAVIDAAAAGHRVYVSLVASSAFSALNAWKKLVGDPAMAVGQLSMVINGRPVRKLCAACKQAYNPDPDTLRKLNMDPAKVTELFQARREPIRDPKGQPIKCDFCNDLRFKGRTGIFEILLVDDAVKQVATATMTPEQNASLLKTAFRKQRGKYLQDAGLGLVEQGVTSVQEVLRVLNPPADGGSAPRSSSRSRPPTAPAAPEIVA